MKGWVGWPVVDGLPTLVVTHQLQVKQRTGKVRQSETDVLPLCYATNHCMTAIYLTPRIYIVKQGFSVRKTSVFLQLQENIIRFWMLGYITAALTITVRWSAMGNWGLSISTRDPNPNPQLANAKAAQGKGETLPHPGKVPPVANAYAMPTHFARPCIFKRRIA